MQVVAEHGSRNVDAWAHADAVAAIVQPLGVDDDIVVGALLFPLLAAGLIDIDRATLAVGSIATHIASDCVKLLQFGGSSHRTEGKALSANQAETLRKMLLAIASDARLVFIRLASRQVPQCSLCAASNHGYLMLHVAEARSVIKASFS